MKILIAGNGATGIYLAKQLSAEKQEVVLLGTDKNTLDQLDSSYNIMTMKGDMLNPADLKEAGVERAGLFVAVCPHQTINLTACQLARQLGAGCTVARIDNEWFLSDYLSKLFKHTGVDTLVYPEKLVAEEILGYVDQNWLTKYVPIHTGQLIVGGVKVAEESPMAGSKLRDLTPGERHFHIGLVRRGKRFVIPRGDDSLMAGDTIYFISRPEHAPEVAALTGPLNIKVKNIMIAGGGKITRMICRLNNGRCHITVLEPDPDRAYALADEFPDVTVVNASPHQLTVLHDEEIAKMDLFLGLTESDETNIVGCMVAKEAGTKKTIAAIEDFTYIAEAERLWIDKVVNKKLITSAAIMRYILGDTVKVGEFFSMEDADVVEIEVKEGAKITEACVKDLSLPAGMTFGGLIRHGRGMIISGDTQLKVADRVLVIFQTGMLLKVQKLFKEV